MNGQCRFVGAFLLLLVSGSATAHEGHVLELVATGPDPQLSGGEVVTIVRLRHSPDDDGGDPVPGERLYVSTGIGRTTTPEVITDAKGAARIVVTSDRGGSGFLTVITKDRNSLDVGMRFDDPEGPRILLQSGLPALIGGERTAIVAKLVDADLRPITGERIEFIIPDVDDGRLDPPDDVTDTAGVASTTFEAESGLDAGDVMTVRAEWPDDPDIYAEVNIVVTDGTDEEFRIIRPLEGTAVEPDTRQSVEVLWTRAGIPVSGQPVTLAATLGTYEADVTNTDGAGIARAFVSSGVEGAAALSATAAGAFTGNVGITFTAPVPADDQYHSGRRSIKLEVVNDRIGIQARTGVTGPMVRSIAAFEGFRLRRSFHPQIFEFQLQTPLSRDALQALARRLEGKYSSSVQSAGVIVQVAGGRLPMLMTNRILVRFDALPLVNARQLLGMFPLADVRLVANSTRRHEIIVKDNAAWNMLKLAEEIRVQTTAPVRYAHPEFILPLRTNAASSDPRFKDQWHHDNPGDDGALPDADMDTVSSWELATGSKSTPVIAVIDRSFKTDHVDLVDNVGTGVFAPKNFVDVTSNSLLDPPAYSRHGTAVAGIIAAIDLNEWGGRGICPDCKLLLMRHATPDQATQAIEHAIETGVRVINNSWGLVGDGEVELDALNDMIKEATDNDIVVLFAMPNATIDNCDKPIELSRLPNVIAVSAITDQDLTTTAGIGDCMDVLGSTRGGIHGITTLGVYASGGVVQDEFIDNFGGTSAATPMVSGTIGLLLDLRPGLSRHQLQRVLQDTSDKVDPYNAEYDGETGFSRGELNSTVVATHGYGRVNTGEAVALLAGFEATETNAEKRGHGGKDLLLRDHAWDWGNMSQPSTVLFTSPRQQTTLTQSVDIKVDVEPFSLTAMPTPQQFADFESEVPESGKRTNVYVRLRNRGPDTVSRAFLKLYWTVGTPLPPLASDFWAAYPANSAAPSSPKEWNGLSWQELSDIEYSGPSIAGCPTRPVPDCLPSIPSTVDAARIATFSLPAIDWDASNQERLSLLAVVDSPDDLLVAKTSIGVPGSLFDAAIAAATDNNVTIWTDTSTHCPQWVVAIEILLLTVTTILIVVILWRWFNGKKVAVSIYVTLTIIVVTVIVIHVKFPWCLPSALDTLKLSMGI